MVGLKRHIVSLPESQKRQPSSAKHHKYYLLHLCSIELPAQLFSLTLRKCQQYVLGVDDGEVWVRCLEKEQLQHLFDHNVKCQPF